MWGVIVIYYMMYLVFEYLGIFGGIGYDVIYYIQWDFCMGCKCYCFGFGSNMYVC